MHFIDPEKVFWDDWLLMTIQVITLIALAIYVWKTVEIAEGTKRTAEASLAAVRESEQARLAALAPRVMVYFSPDDIQFADIVVENVGAGTARNVEIQFEPALQSTYGDHAGAFFETAKPHMPPGYRIAHHFDSWPQYLGANLPKRYVAHVHYSGAENGLDYVIDHVLDVTAMEHRIAIDRKGLHQLVGALEKMDNNIRSQLKDTVQIAQRHHRFLLHHPSTSEAAYVTIDQLLAWWTVISHADSTDGARVSWDGAADFLQLQALRAATAAVQEQFPDSVQKALFELVAASMQPRYLGDSYSERITAAFDALREVFPREIKPNAEA